MKPRDQRFGPLRCDALAVSGGFNPNLHLFAQAGGKLAYHASSGSLRPLASRSSVEIIGAAGTQHPVGPRLSPAGDQKRQWVDLLHDVTVADLRLALRENYTSVEHVKPDAPTPRLSKMMTWWFAARPSTTRGSQSSSTAVK
jgi:sarcosine oxidase subunit alpha